MWKYYWVSSDEDKNKDKTLKLVSNPIRCLVNEPEHEISTRNGKLGVCDYEILRKHRFSNHCGSLTVSQPNGKCCQNLVSTWFICMQMISG